ncbi:alkane hydroxylase MAH1-like [Hibiscus syriacus]|uniref:alkane hydroxylase MAH1-like n=1 Tax=Hibiscus syriacus TaxID=106335 RepID=UPI001921E5FE|nr:alkane hydroxylase MAH1-like [Hibiscus syriacus]
MLVVVAYFFAWPRVPVVEGETCGDGGLAVKLGVGRVKSWASCNRPANVTDLCVNTYAPYRMVAQGFVRTHRFHSFLSRASHYKVAHGLVPVMNHFAKRCLVADLEDIFRRFTFDATCILVTGHDPRSLSVEFPDVLFSKALDDAEEAIFYRHVRPPWFIKLQRWLNTGQERKYGKAGQVLDDIIAEYIWQKRKDLNRGSNSTSEIVEEGVDLLTPYITEEKSIGLECDDKFLRDYFEYDACREGHHKLCSYLVHLAGFPSSNSRKQDHRRASIENTRR